MKTCHLPPSPLRGKTSDFFSLKKCILPYSALCNDSNGKIEEAAKSRMK
jgi:hypothetical protein